MLEIFQNFEQLTGRISPSVLFGAALAVLLPGLFIWLGGLSLRKIIVMIAGAVSGCVVGLYVIGRNLFSASLSAALAAVSALIFEMVLIPLLAAVFASAVAFAVLAGPYFEPVETTTTQNEMSEQTTKADLGESIEELKAFAFDAGKKIKQAGIKKPKQKWAIVAAPAVICIVGGIILWRLTSALFFSVLGTMVVFLGIILLLSYKAIEPVGHVRGNPLIYGIVFIAMAASGTIVQLLLSKSTKKQKVTIIKASKEKKDTKDQEPEQIEEQDWRSA